MNDNFNLDDFKTSGIKVNYYIVCKRKLWLFDRNLSMENNSEKVTIGKVLDNDYYNKNNNKNYLLDNLICIDIVDNENIGEIKVSDKLPESGRIQILYYLYYLKKSLGINKKGTLNYPKQHKREFVELDEEAEKNIENILIDIKSILSLDKPPPIDKKPYCTKCSYYELCFI
mgnify:CR=1 FL=1